MASGQPVPTWDDVSRFQARLLIIERKSPRTVDDYVREAGRFLKWLEERGYASVDERVVEEYLIETGEGMSASRIRGRYQALKKFLQSVGIQLDWERVKPGGRPSRRFYLLSEDEVREIIDYAYSINEQYGLMLQLGYEAALRVGELIAARILQFEPERMAFIKHPEKREDPCEVPLSRELTRRLSDWLSRQERAGPGDFIFKTKYGNPWTRATFNSLVWRRVADELGYRDARYHDFARHSRATNLLRSGVDIYTVNRILCHARMDTTTVYVHLARAEELRGRIYNEPA